MCAIRSSRKNAGLQQVSVRVFGGLGISYNETPVVIAWGSQKARLLFCSLLVSYDQWIHRDRLIEVLWPGCDVAAGVNNFKTTLSRLRKSFSGPHAINPVMTQGEALRINTTLISLDASEFRAAATAGIKTYARGDLKGAKLLLEKAQDLYTGDFLPEEPFNPYLTAARDDFGRLHTSVITTLGKVYEQEGNKDALEAIRFLVSTQYPLVEPA
ncbi:BTAD domain-containing putative transcriptional regulator [Geobacter sp. DSM 9736]|uniref:AfsR/SARP family transcriptional regulator n=1 Tax=Geobacter sp. DSM 9736 TaxID=1277350 RepID=UPI000B50A7B3|nr:BTAD domain-containing putative transcriptional regulator [Geobacter sp. DSM 9736]